MPNQSQVAAQSSASRVGGASTGAVHFRLASPRNAVGAGAVLLVLVAGVVVLSIINRSRGTSSPEFIFLAFPFAVVGVLVARRQPRNAIGWILLGVAACFLLIGVGRAYSVIDYRTHQGSLPLGWLAVSLTQLWTPMFLLMILPVLLFPAGRVPSTRWRWSLWAYAVDGGVLSIVALVEGIAIAMERHVHIASTGMPTNGIGGFLGAVNNASFVLDVAAVGLGVVWIIRLIASYHKARGDSRQQLKWLMAGGALTIIAVVAGATAPNSPSVGLEKILLTLMIFLGFVSLPVTLGVAVLKYRLYDVDRIVSRTLSYAILTGLLIGVYVGVVTLATRVLPISSSLGVAASTLVAVAVFNPLRTRVQRLVDRRFNRAGYDAQQQSTHSLEGYVTAPTWRP